MMIWLLCLVALVTLPTRSHAQYQFLPIDVPFQGASRTEVTGFDQGLTVGSYQNMFNQTHGFLTTCTGETFPLVNLTPKAVSPGGIVGWYRGARDLTVGFLLTDGTFSPLTGPRAGEYPTLGPPITLTEAHAINDDGVVVGTYRDANDVWHGFRYTPGGTPKPVVTLDVPGATTTVLVAIANSGVILGTATIDGSRRVFLWDPPNAPTFLDVPGGLLDVIGLANDGRIIGNTPSGRGFVFHQGSVEEITVPDSTLTQLFGIDRDGRLVGRYRDAQGVYHGLLAIPEGLPDPCEDDTRKDARDRDKHGRGHRQPR